MAHIVADWIKETASNKPNAATAFNLPDTGYTGGYRSFDSVMATNDTCFYSATNGTAWEVGLGTFTAGTPDTLARTTLLSSSSGSAIDFSGGGDVTVELVDPATAIGRTYTAHQSLIPGGRLTTESGVPVSTSDRTAQASLYYTPYVHNVICLWDGTQWVPTVFAETLVTGATLTGLTSGKPYDVFAYLSSGALALELLVWTNDTTRATAVTLQDGRYCKSGDKTRLLVGTIYTTGTTTTEDSLANRYVANLYNAVQRSLAYSTNDTGHTYASSTIRSYAGSDAHRISFVSPIGGTIDAVVGAYLYRTGGSAAEGPELSYGLDSNSAVATGCSPLDVFVLDERIRALGGGYTLFTAGRHFLQILQRVAAYSSSTGNYSYGIIGAKIAC